MIVEPWIDAKDRPVPNKGTAQLLKFNKAEVPDIGAIISKCDFLSSFEIERARKFRYDKDRNTFIISRSLLRFILSPILQEPAKHIDISMTELGKPYLSRHPDIRFNISHSSKAVNKWQIFNLEINRDYGAAVCCHPTVEKLKLFDITRWFENTL